MVFMGYTSLGKRTVQSFFLVEKKTDGSLNTHWLKDTHQMTDWFICMQTKHQSIMKGVTTTFVPFKFVRTNEQLDS